MAQFWGSTSDYNHLGPYWSVVGRREKRSANTGASCPIPVLAPPVDQPTPGSITRLKNAYKLRNDLQPGWAAQFPRFAEQACEHLAAGILNPQRQLSIVLNNL
jgi:hypothetical protein